MMNKVLITGANGFLGYYLVQHLLEKNYWIIATGAGPCRLPFQHSRFLYHTMDISNEKMIQEVLMQYQPDMIVHAGALSKPDECEVRKEVAQQTNVMGTQYLLDHARKLKSQFIFLSTDFVFNGEKGMYSETDQPDPVNFYGDTKLQAEQLVELYPFKWCIVRTVLVYGKPFQNRQNLVTGSALALQNDETLKIFDDQIRTPTFVQDLAGAIVMIMDQKATGIYHISGNQVMTPFQMVVEMANYLHLDVSKVHRISAGDFIQPAKRPAKTGFNISKAQRELGYSPISFQKGLQKTFAIEEDHFPVD